MADVFISYASADVDQARSLDGILEQQGYSVWWDKHLVAGRQYQESIKHELLRASVVLAVWTPKSVSSAWVYSEARRGVERHVLVQVRTRDVTIDDLPAPFDVFHCPYVDDIQSVLTAVAALASGRRQPGPAGSASSQELPEGEPTDSPPPSATKPGASPGMVVAAPRFNTTLVGRDAEIEDLLGLLAEGARLVTLTGVGGSGKTRLAVALAQRLADATSDELTIFVPAENIERTEELWAAIGTALGAPAESRVPPQLFEYLGSSRAHLVLDNLEQIPTAADVVAELLQVAPAVSVVATSRLPLHVEGEHEYAVPLLAVPAQSSLEVAAASAAVQMFVSHARLVNRTFELNTTNAADVVEICRRLDGLPLAIELIAARVKLMSPRALLPQLEKALDLKGAGDRRPRRQETLRAAIGWSYDLLPADAQRTLRVLAMLPAGATLSALEYILAQLSFEVDPIDQLEKLVDTSLVVSEEPDAGEPRFRLLNTVRAYAEEELGRMGEVNITYAATLAWAHWEIFDPTTTRDQEGLTRVERTAHREHGNLRTLLDHDIDIMCSDGQKLLWYANTALMTVATVSFPDALYGEAERWISQALLIARQTSNAALLAQSLLLMSEMRRLTGDIMAALELSAATLEQTRALNIEAADPIFRPETLLGSALNNRAVVFTDAQDIASARAALTEALESGIPLLPRDQIMAHLNLAILKSVEGLGHEALALEREAIALAKTFGFRTYQVMAEHNAACSLREIGQLEEAEAMMREGIPNVFGMRHIGDALSSVDDYALLLSDLGRFEDSALLYGATQATRESINSRLAPHELEEHARAQHAAQTTLGDEWERVKAKGARLTVQEAWKRVTGG